MILVFSYNLAYGESCYSLGYRFGICATKSLHGLPCKPENDFVLPIRCRGLTETNKGILAGTEAVYELIGLDKKTGKPKSSTTLNILTSPLSTLNAKLEGKSVSEINKLFGKPNRESVAMGYKCWIYGNTYTSKDRAVIFNGGKVLTITYY